MEFDPKILEDENVRNTVVSSLSEKGFIVKAKDDYNKSLEDYVRTLSPEDEKVSHIIGPVVRREREPLENLVKELTGLEKTSIDGKTEKALDYAKRALSEFTNSLNEKAKKGITNDQLIKDFDDYKVSVSSKLKASEKKIEELNATLLQKDVIFDIKNSIAKREGKFSNDEKIKGLIPEIVNSVQRQAMELKSEYRELGGQKILAIIGENGSILMNDKTGNPLTVDDWIEAKLAPVMEVGKNQPGAGTGADQQDKGSFPIPDTIKTQVQLDDYLKNELKLDYKDKDVLEKRAKIIKDRGLRLM